MTTTSKISWQQPFVNTFKHFAIISDKNVLKQGNVTNCMDSQVKSSTYKIVGSSPTSNFISLPKLSGQSINLTGRYIYFLFKPMPNKCFSIHIDVQTVEKVGIRFSFSNLFKEFKSSTTWFQFPYVIQSPKDTVYEKTEFSAKDLSGSAPPITKWTILGVDLVQLVQTYANRSYHCVRSYRLCANMIVKNVITSDLVYEPGISHAEARLKGTSAFPRELSYPCEKHDNWLQLYDYILFPSDQFNSTGHSHILIDSSSTSNESSTSVKALKDKKTITSTSSRDYAIRKSMKSKEFNLPLVNVPLDRCEDDEDENEEEDEIADDLIGQISDIHVFAKSNSNNNDHVNDNDEPDMNSQLQRGKKRESKSKHKEKSVVSSLQPDPIMRLRKMIGYGCINETSGGNTTNNSVSSSFDCIKWSHDSQYIIYNCQAVVVAYHLATGLQWCFVGHSDKVSCLALSPNNDYLVSGQTGPHSLIRLWDFKSRKCLSIFKKHDHSLHLLEYSSCGNYICGIGKDKQGKTLLVLWDVKEITTKNSNFTPRLISMAHTDAHIARVLFVHYDSSRLISCGRDNIKFWRLKEDTLRCCSVNLSSYIHALQLQHSSKSSVKKGANNSHLEFTDLCINTNSNNRSDDKAYACTLNGQIFELSLAKMEIDTVRALVPSSSNIKESSSQLIDNESMIHLNSLTVSDSHCVTGSTDGFVRIWSLDFSKVFAEAKYEAPINLVRLSPNSMKALTVTNNGSLGILDLKKKEYITLVRSHTQSILDVAYDATLKYLASVSNDLTVRVWNYKTFRQLYDFSSPNEKPTRLCFLNRRIFSNKKESIVLACGFSSGKIRIFEVNDACMLHELSSPHLSAANAAKQQSFNSKQSKYEINNLQYASNGKRLISTDQMKSISLYDVENKYNLIRLLPNMIGTYSSISLSSDQNQLAIVGANDLVVTVFDTYSLNEILRIDLSSMTSMNLKCSTFPSSNGFYSSNFAELESDEFVTHLSFAPPRELDQLICVTSHNRLVKFNSTNGHLISIHSRLHKNQIDCLCISNDGRYLVTCGDNGLVKVWDYEMRFEKSFQTFIGHSSPVNRVLFTPDNAQLITVGDTMIVWDVLTEIEDERPGINNNDDVQEANGFHLVDKRILTNPNELPEGREFEDMKELPIRVVREIKETNQKSINNNSKSKLKVLRSSNVTDYNTLNVINEASFNEMWDEVKVKARKSKEKTTRKSLANEHTQQLSSQYSNLASWSNISFEKPRTPPIANIYIDSIGEYKSKDIEDTFSEVDLGMKKASTKWNIN